MTRGGEDMPAVVVAEMLAHDAALAPVAISSTTADTKPHLHAKAFI